MDDTTKKMYDEEKMVDDAFQHLVDTYLASRHRKKVEIITKAFNFARQAHKGVRRLSGEPYIMHPIAVAQIVCSEIGLGSTSICAALLHDVVEDTSVTFEELKDEGFSDEVLTALKCLTRTEDEEYETFIRRVATNPLAIKVKIQDLKDNMDVSRLNGKLHWKMDTYKAALEYLEKADRRKTVYVDMDNVLVDFESGINALSDSVKDEYAGRLDEVPHIFSMMKPYEGALDAIERLKEKYDIYILSTAPWNNPTAWSDKLEWVQRYFGKTFHKRLILSHHKNLNKGYYLIDDRTKNGASGFEGELILFGSERFPDWAKVVEYLL